MQTVLIHCGPTANESELKAFYAIKDRINSVKGEGKYILLSNLAFSVNPRLQSDEIDLVVIGPPGVKIIEIKHWEPRWVKEHPSEVEREAEKLTIKVKKIASTLRQKIKRLPYVEGLFLLTREPSRVQNIRSQKVRGISFLTLKDWKDAIGFEEPTILRSEQIDLLGKFLYPHAGVSIDGSLRSFAGYINLERITPKTESFHRVYKGIHAVRQDRVLLHLYDLSATNESYSKAHAKAEREFETLRQLQLHPWAPRILDSFQSAPGYAGEMYFFTLVDPLAPSIQQRIADKTWTLDSRIKFVQNALNALVEFHKVEVGGVPLVHRGLNPDSILVRSDDSVIFTRFGLAKLPAQETVASTELPINLVEFKFTVAPEVKKQGLSAATQRSDIYGLCASLKLLFQGIEDERAINALYTLDKGLAEEPDDRSSLEELIQIFNKLLEGQAIALPSVPPAKYWTEDQIVLFRGNNKYKIISLLGSGGVGTAFKVVQVDNQNDEEMGTYVAKIAYDQEVGNRILRSYKLARSYLTRHPGLSAIYEIADEWKENEFLALLTWIDGTPLYDFIGVFPLLAEDLQETSPENLSIRWLNQACEALQELHRHGLVHGDISPKNMLVVEDSIVLTDYDFVAKTTDPVISEGTRLYCAPNRRVGGPNSPSDDIFALATSFFHVFFEKEPFSYDGKLQKQKGVNWNDIDISSLNLLPEFIKKATDADPEKRFVSAQDALHFLKQVPSKDPIESFPASGALMTQGKQELSDNNVEWLKLLLQSYPGSLWGNKETRGLDSEFAEQTYVETELERVLENDVLNRSVRLVILCGNAGDGKTALLQHLAKKFDFGNYPSSARILEGKSDDGLIIRMNLDGSAAWEGKSADELLDEFLAPFQNGQPSQDIVHLLAINDGRLLEWIEKAEEQTGRQTQLTQDLYEFLQDEKKENNSYIRFVDLNSRSLVGNIDFKSGNIKTDFLEQLIFRLYGGTNAEEIWKQCNSCSMQDRCEILRGARLFGPKGINGAYPNKIKKRALKRLFDALQAVHLRGETHITIRELRGALVYILFGIHFCDQIHENPAITPPYWDRAFSFNSGGRQGDVLRELILFDPALEAHPQIDRYLISPPSPESNRMAPHYEDLSLESARRRAYFEWTEEHIRELTGEPDTLGLARGGSLKRFAEIPLMENDKKEQLIRQLCAGISRLEDLPPQALDRNNVVPLRIIPRTPTETAFWAEKSLASFELNTPIHKQIEGIEQLHRYVFLSYTYKDGRKESLRLGAELFHLLLELGDGFQLGDVSTDDVFANLSIFVQRLVREDERTLFAWNPIQDEGIYKVYAEIIDGLELPEQKLVIEALK